MFALVVTRTGLGKNGAPLIETASFLGVDSGESENAITRACQAFDKSCWFATLAVGGRKRKNKKEAATQVARGVSRGGNATPNS